MRIPSTLGTVETVGAVDTVGAIAQHRYRMLKRADELLRDPGEAVAENNDRLPGVSGLLLSSLEELKVAEEELRAQNSVLEAQRAAVDERVRHYQNLFLHLPAPAFITDNHGTIRELNLAAASLFRREAKYLEGRPLSSLLADDYRAEFRTQLSRAKASQGVRDWRLVATRVGDVPVEVHATVSRIPDVGPTQSGLLYWVLAAKPSSG